MSYKFRQHEMRFMFSVSSHKPMKSLMCFWLRYLKGSYGYFTMIKHVGVKIDARSHAEMPEWFDTLELNWKFIYDPHKKAKDRKLSGGTLVEEDAYIAKRVSREFGCR